MTTPEPFFWRRLLREHDQLSHELGDRPLTPYLTCFGCFRGFPAGELTQGYCPSCQQRE